MNKQDIVDAMANAADISANSAEAALDAFLSSVMNTVKQGDKVTIVGFGGWEAAHRAARSGRNPQTGEVINIPASVVPKFKAGKKFKDLVNTHADKS